MKTFKYIKVHMAIFSRFDDLIYIHSTTERFIFIPDILMTLN